jgi:D-lactate dehydrogenase
MCCGVKDNSYHTLAAIKVVFADGSELDTSNSDSCQQFLAVQKDFITELMSLVNDVKADIELVDKISHKYRLKNTTGYGLNALIDYQDPIDIISH